MSDDTSRRPNDHHVEPLFAGLGVEEHAPAPPEGARGVALTVLLTLVASALVLWWLV